jgi:hypothetical protein
VRLVSIAGAPPRFLPAEITPAQRWALATTAIVTHYFEGSHELLGGVPVTSESREESLDTLRDPWEIENRRQLQDMLKHLAAPEAQHRLRDLAAQIAAGTARVSDDVSAEDIEFVRTFGVEMGERGIVADSLCRMVYVAGEGYVAGFLSEAEAWGYSMAAAARIQRSFGSWEEMGAQYLMGVAWRRGADEDLEASYHELLADPASPWRTLPWGLPLA